MRTSQLLFVVQWLIVTLQLCRFLGNAYISYNWNSPVARVTMAIADFVTEIPLVTPTTAYIMAACTCGWFILFGTFSAFTHHHFEWIIPLRFMRMMFVWSPVFFFPILIPHLKMILPCLSYSIESYVIHPFYEELTCWSLPHIGFFAFSLVIATTTFAMQYLTTVCFYNNEIPSGGNNATSNGISLNKHACNAKYTAATDITLFLAKTVLLILHIGGHTPSWRYAMGFLTFLSGMATAAHLIYAMPWWYDLALFLHIFQAFILAWTGFVAILMTIFNDADGTAMLYFVMLPVLLLAAQMTMQWRIKAVGALNEREITSGTLVITKIRYYARSYFQWLAQFGDIYLDMTEAQAREMKMCISLVQETLEIGHHRFPENVDLHLYTTQFYLSIGLNRILAYRALRLAENAPSLTLDQRFHCQAVRHVLHEATIKEQSEEIRDYIEFKTRRIYADQAVSHATRALIEFWTEVMQMRPDIDKLSSTGERARHHLNTAITHFERILTINPTNVQIRRVYGVVCLEIFGDVERAQRLFTEADMLINTKKQNEIEYSCGDFLRSVALNLDIFDEDNGVVGVSLNAETMGSVEHANVAFLDMLGFKSHADIVGKNINVIIPNPIKAHHNRFMSEYLVTLRSRVMGRTRVLLAQNVAGDLVKIAMHVRYESEGQGKLLAVMKTVFHASEACIMVDPKTYSVTAATANFAEIFGWNRRVILAQRVTLFDIVPELKDEEAAYHVNAQIYQKLASQGGYATAGRHVVTKERFHLHCYLSQVHVFEDSFLFMRCQIAELDRGNVGEDFSDVNDADAIDSTAYVSAFGNRSKASGLGSTHASSEIESSKIFVKQKSVAFDDRKLQSRQAEGPLPSLITTPLHELDDTILHASEKQSRSLDGGIAGLQHSKFDAGFGYLGYIGDAPRSIEHQRLLVHRKSPMHHFPTHDALQFLYQKHSSLPLPRGSPESFSTPRSPPSAPTSPAFTPFILLDDSPGSAAVSESWVVAVNADMSMDTPLSELSLMTSLPPKAERLRAQLDSSSPWREHALRSPSSSSVEFLPPIEEDAQESLNLDELAQNRHEEDHVMIRIDDMANPLPGHLIEAVSDQNAVEPGDTVAGGTLSENFISGEKHSRRSHQGAKKKLRRAIENDNKQTMHQLDMFTYLAVFIITVVSFLAILDFFLTAHDLDHTDRLLDNIYYSSLRQSQAAYIGATLFLLSLIRRFPNAINLRKMLYRPLVHANDSAPAFIKAAINRVGMLNKAIAENSAIVDMMPTRSARRHALRNTDALSVLTRTPHNAQKYGYTSMSLRDLVTHITSMAAWTLYEGKANFADDYGLFYVLGNTVSRSISSAFEEDTRLTVEEIGENISSMVDRTVMMFIITLISVLIIATALLLPILVRVERSKAAVLDVLLAVPQSVRKGLRRRAMRVYRFVEKVDHATGRVHRHSDDDDEDGTENDSAPPVTVAFSPTIQPVSAPDDDLDTLFRRYNKFRNHSEGFSIGEEKQETDKHLIHTQQRDRARSVLQAVLPNVEYQLGDTLLEKKHTSESLFSGFSVTSANNLENTSMERKQKHSRYNIWTANAVRLATVRFFIFMALICAYFIVLVLESKSFEGEMHSAVQRVFLGNIRNPRMIVAQIFSLVHLFFNRAEIAATEPLNPLIHSPADYYVEGMNCIEQVEKSFFAVVFGDVESQVHGRVDDARQRQVVFDNMCEIDPESMYSLYPDAKTVKHLYTECGAAQSGVNTKGLWASFAFISHHFRVIFLPEHNKALAHFLTGGPPKFDEETTLSITVAFEVTYKYFNDFTYHHLVYSGAVYKLMASEVIAFFTKFRHTLIGLCGCFIFIAYFFLLRPTTILLARSCSHANAIMLLLPAQVLELNAAQKYVENHISRE